MSWHELGCDGMSWDGTGAHLLSQAPVAAARRARLGAGAPVGAERSLAASQPRLFSRLFAVSQHAIGVRAALQCCMRLPPSPAYSFVGPRVNALVSACVPRVRRCTCAFLPRMAHSTTRRAVWWWCSLGEATRLRWP